MATIQIEGLATVRDLLAGVAPALQRANEKAQNKMAYELMLAEREQAKMDLDRPAATTISSILYKKYNATSLTFKNPGLTVPVPGIKGAGVFVGDLFGKTLATFDDLLGVQIRGGKPAGPKRSAKILQRYGWMKPNQVWVPAIGAPLDQYGNIRGSLISYMLQNMGTNPYAPVVEDAKFMLMGEPGNFSGVWWKGSVSSKTKGGAWRPLLWFIDEPSYSPRYDWEGRAEEEFDSNFYAILDWYVQDELKKL